MTRSWVNAAILSSFKSLVACNIPRWLSIKFEINSAGKMIPNCRQGSPKAFPVDISSVVDIQTFGMQSVLFQIADMIS